MTHDPNVKLNAPITLIAALTVAILSTSLTAQQPKQVPITIKVTDQTGAVLGGAAVRIDDSFAKSAPRVDTDYSGLAVVDLTPGSHLISISARGFANWAIQFDVQEGANQPIEATLRFGPQIVECGPCVVADPVIPLDRSTIDYSIPVHVLESPVSVYTAHNSRDERATKSQLERLIAENDLGKWTFTHTVVINKHAEAHSDPRITLPAKFEGSDQLLSAYLQEQMEWFLASHPVATQAALDELRMQFGNPQPTPGQDASDSQLPYRSLLIGVLGRHADRAALGNERTDALLRLSVGNRNDWTAQTAVKDRAQIEAVLKRHDLDSPDAHIENSVP